MRGLIEHQIRESSIKNIFHVDMETYAKESRFFSNRRAMHNGDQTTGRMINIIGFND